MGARSSREAGGPGRIGKTAAFIIAAVFALLGWSHAALCAAQARNALPEGTVGQLAPLEPYQRPPLPPVDRTIIPPPAPLPPLPSAPERRGAVNPRTGEHYLPSGAGVVNPRTGEYYPPSGSGYINPRTGEYVPPIDQNRQ